MAEIPHIPVDTTINQSHLDSFDHQWATNLRINLDYYEKLNKQLDGGVIERHQAAKALLLERDSKSHTLIHNLREGDRIYQDYQRKKVVRSQYLTYSSSNHSLPF